MREFRNTLFVIALSLCVVALEGCGGSGGGTGGETTYTPPTTTILTRPPVVVGSFWSTVNKGGLKIKKGDYTGTDEDFIESFKTKEYQDTGGAVYDALGLRYFYARGLTGKGIKVVVLDGGFSKAHAETKDAATSKIDTLKSRMFWLPIPVKEPVEGNNLKKNNKRTSTHGTYMSMIIAAGKDDVKQHGIAYNATLYHFKKLRKLDPLLVFTTFSPEGQIAIDNFNKNELKKAEQNLITSFSDLRKAQSGHIYQNLSELDKEKLSTAVTEYTNKLYYAHLTESHKEGMKVLNMSMYSPTINKTTGKFPKDFYPDNPVGNYQKLIKAYQENMDLSLDNSNRFDIVLSLCAGNEASSELGSPANIAHWLEVKDTDGTTSLGGYAITSTSVASKELNHLLPGGTFDSTQIIPNMIDAGYSGDFPNKCGSGKSRKFCLAVVETIINVNPDESPILWGWKPEKASEKCEAYRVNNELKISDDDQCYDWTLPIFFSKTIGRTPVFVFRKDIMDKMILHETTNRPLVGTSATTAVVSGVATLLREAFPALKAYEIVKLMLESAHKMPVRVTIEKEVTVIIQEKASIIKIRKEVASDTIYGQGILSPWRALLLPFGLKTVVGTTSSSYEATGFSLDEGEVRVAPSLGALPLLKPLKGNTPLQILFFDKFRDPNRYWVQDINDTFLSSVSRGEEKPVLSFFSSVSSTLKAQVGKGRLLLNKEERKMAYEGVLGEVPYRVGIGGEVLEEEDRVLALASHGDLLEEKRSFSLGSGFSLGFAQGEKEGYRVYSGYRKTFGSGFLYAEAGIVREGEAFLGGRGTAFMEFSNGGRTWYGRIQGRIRAGEFEIRVAAYMGRSFSGGEGSRSSWLRLKEGRSQSGGISVKRSLSRKRSIELGALFPLKSSYVGEMSQLEVLKGDLLGTLRWSRHDVRLSSEGREKLFYGSYTQVVKTGGKIHLSFGVRLQRNHVPNRAPESFYLLQYRHTF